MGNMGEKIPICAPNMKCTFAAHIFQCGGVMLPLEWKSALHIHSDNNLSSRDMRFSMQQLGSSDFLSVC